MLGRKHAPRRQRQLVDRGHAPRAPARPAPGAPPAADPRPAVTFVWPDVARRHRTVVLVASFDGCLHHRMSPPVPLAGGGRIAASDAASAAAAFSLTLRVPPGTHTYKFLVDGVWSVNPSSIHPVTLTPDGVKHHLLTVVLSPDPMQLRPAPNVTMARLAELDSRPTTTVFRSASASAVPTRPATAQSSTSLHEAPRSRRVDVAPRGSSFNAPPQVGAYSQTQTANRKSLLQRVGYGWIKRFSSRNDEPPSYNATPDHELDRSSHGDRSATALYRAGKDRVSLFPSQSDPSVGPAPRDAEKENSFRNWASTGTPNRTGSRRGTGVLRGSARTATVTVSHPTKVDEPRDLEEVSRQADNWRQMAKHLQDDLFDPKGARELFSRAIQHREKHGLWCTTQNAQVHVDLARNLSKADQMKNAEFHLRIALRIYDQIEAGPEHVADLLLYVGVVVDRQRRREEAEELYRKALAMYKRHSVIGNNRDIAVKNLSLNLRKQGREEEIDEIRREYGAIKSSSVIV